jgi:hypothetical protein
MHRASQGVASDEVFYASVESALTKARFYGWNTLILVVGLLIINEYDDKGNSPLLLDLSLAFLVIGGCMEWYFRRRLRPGLPLVTLSAEGITATTLKAPGRQLLWSEIEAISLNAALGRRLLTFQLNDSTGPSAWRGAPVRGKRGKYVLSLAAFSPATQQKLIEAIDRRHAQEHASYRSH